MSSRQIWKQEEHRAKAKHAYDGHAMPCLLVGDAISLLYVIEQQADWEEEVCAACLSLEGSEGSEGSNNST